MCFANHLRDSGIQRITLQWPSGQSLRNPFPVSESLGKSQFSSNQLNEIIASRKNIFAKWSVQIIDFLTDFFNRLDYGLSNTDRLYEYISARMYGEHQGACDSAYPQCPFSAFKLLDPEELLATIAENAP